MNRIKFLPGETVFCFDLEHYVIRKGIVKSYNVDDSNSPPLYKVRYYCDLYCGEKTQEYPEDRMVKTFRRDRVIEKFRKHNEKRLEFMMGRYDKVKKDETYSIYG